jgi:TPR repeat protein
VNFAKKIAENDEFLGLVKFAALEKDGAKASEMLLLAGSPKFSEDQNRYANALETGNGCLVNHKAALDYWTIAAENGNVEAMIELGTRFEESEANLSVKWYKLAYEEKSAAGGYGYGAALGTGDGATRDVEKALEVFQFAAENRDSRALVDLGFMHENGYAEKNDGLALEYYDRAAKTNCPAGLYAMGRVFKDGSLGVERDFDRAITYLEQAKSLGYTRAKDLIEQIRGTT